MGREIDLILATQKGNISVIKRLLGATKKGVFRNKVSPNFQDARGYTPLHHAIMYGQKEALLMLLRYGADPRISDRSGNYPLHTASQQGDYDSLQLLIEHSPIRPEIDQQNAHDDTSLLIAAQEGMYALVEFLLRAGADPQIVNKLDQNCLELASYYGRTDVVNLLLRKVPRILDTPHSTKHTCLHFAARNGHNSILQLLLDKGIDINTTCKTGSCLHEAALHGKIETVAYVLDRDIDVYLTNALGQTVLEAIQSLAASLCRTRIQQLISDHICHKLKLGNKRNSRSFHNGISPNSGFHMKDLDDRVNFQRSTSFNVNPPSKISSVSNVSESSPVDTSYSSPYQQPSGSREAPASRSLDQSVQYSNEAIMYTRDLRRSLDSNAHFDDDVTHAPLSVIRKPNTKFPISLQGNQTCYYQTPSAKLNSPRTDPHSLPPVYNNQTERGGGSTSSEDYVVKHSYNFGDIISGASLQSPDVITSDSDLDEISVGSSSQNSHNNFPDLHPKRSAPIAQRNPAHSFFTDILSDDANEVEQEMDQNFQDYFIRTSGLPTDGSYIPLNERSASVLGCSESIDRREFVKNCVRHPLANLEDSSSRIVIRNGDRVTFYPATQPDPHSANQQESLRSTSPSASSSISRSSPNNEYSLPQGPAFLPVPVRRKSNKSPQDTPTKPLPYHSDSNSRHLQPLIPEPVLNRPRKKSAPALYSVTMATDRNVSAYSQPDQNPQILRRNSARGMRRRINTYHEGDCEHTPTNYPNDLQINFSSINQSGPISQTGRKALEKPPAGKPRGSKGYQSGNLTSDTSRSTSPSLSETQNKSNYSQEHTPYGDLVPDISPYFHTDYIPTYKVPIRPVSTSGEETPQEFLDNRSDLVISPEEQSMSLQVENIYLDSKTKDKNRTLTRDEPPVESIDCEWESIDNVMDMVAQISSEIESSTSTEMTASLSPTSVPDLMQSINLPHRAALLMSNGFDDIGFLAGILTQDELEEIGIEDICEIQHILATVNLLPAPLVNTKPSSVSQWLIQIGLHQLYHLFTSKGYNTINDICYLWEVQLSTVLEIHQLGYRKRISYSLSHIRAATPERNFAPSNSEFYSPPDSATSDKSFPMSSPLSSNVPPPPPRHDSYALTQQLWPQYDRNATNSYPRDCSRAAGRRCRSTPHEEQYSQPNPLANNPPPLPPKNPALESNCAKKKPKILPKPVLNNNIMLKNSSSFSVTPLCPSSERLGHTGERQVAQTKNSFSQIGVQLRHTVDLMSDNSKQTLISYLSQSLQPLQPRSPTQYNPNENRNSPAMRQLSSRHGSSCDTQLSLNLRNLSRSHVETPEFITSPIYQQRIEETGENMPPETGPKRSDIRYHSMHARDSTRHMSSDIQTDESIASYYVEGGTKGHSEPKKNRFGKFRSSKKVIKQNPVYESSTVLQGLPVECHTARGPPVNRVSKPILATSSTAPLSSSSLPPSSSSEADFPVSEIRIRSPLVMRRETMSPCMESYDIIETDAQNIWVHPVNKLTSGSISYTVKFLGSAVVSSLVGKETINNTCKRIKETSKRGKKISSINLSISWKWIKLYAIEKERIIQEHMMHHISYSSQYMEDLRMFAFISRDKKNPKYYCNVFQSPTIEHADEVVHTLGQAFEISYQHLLNAKRALKATSTKSNVNKPVTYTRSSPLKFHRSQSVDGVL